jgi:hypothetical protein
MRRPNLSKWKKDLSLKQLLLYAQTIEELLFHHTVDSYKSPALNSHLRAKELQILAVDYRNGRLKQGALKPVIEELKWSLRNDIVITNCKNNIFDVYADSIDKTLNEPRRLLETVEALNEELERYYWNKLKELTVECILNNGSDDDIVKLATSLSAEVEMLGFSRSYLYIENKQFFFDGNRTEDIAEPSCVTKFLDKFDVSPRKWNVIFRGSKEFLALQPYAKPFNIEISTDISNKQIKTQIFSDLQLVKGVTELYIFNENIIAKDPYSAREIALTILNSFVSAYLYHDHNIKPAFDKKAFVLDIENNKTFVLKEDPNPMTCRSVRTDALRIQEINWSVDLIKGGHLNTFSTSSIKRAFEYHKTALESNTTENQLLNLWAAIEGLLPPPPLDGDRISFYLDALVPPATMTYAERLFDYVTDSLLHAGKSVNRIIESVPNGNDFFEKTVMILTADDMEDNRQQLLAKIKFNPLLNYRCLLMSSKFSSTKQTLKTLEDHRKKVKWHLQRIYISRNQIMHNATSLPYVSTLVENLHTYVDIFIYCITSLAYSSGYKKDISTFVKMIGVHESTLFAELNKIDAKCSTTNYKDVVFGKDNCFVRYH